MNYTFIIPHKNIPDLLQRCLNSIQEREDIQIIVVDDNSDPAIVDFERFPGVNKKNTEVYFTKEGRGAGYARNVGLKHAKGKWILFADADDFFNENFLLYTDLYLNNDADIIYWDANSVDCYTGKRTYRCLHLNYLIRTKNISKSELWLRYKFGEPWCKMIRRRLVLKHSILFDETPIHNDTMFSLLVGHYAKKIERNPFKLYCVTLRAGSISNKVSLEKLKTRIRIFKKVSDFYVLNKLNLSEDRHFGALYDIKKFNKVTYEQEYNLLLKDYKRLFIEWNLVKIHFKRKCKPFVKILRYIRNKYNY